MSLLILKIFLVQNISIVNIPGLPLLTMDTGLTIIYVLLFVKNKTYIALNPIHFPFQKPFILLAISWTVSAIFSQIGFVGAASQLLGNICQSLIIVWMMWNMIEDEQDFSFLLKWFALAFFCACLYAFYEKLIGSNPLQDYYATLMNDSEKTISYNTQYTEDIVRGQRVQSIFEHPIGAGINFAMFVIWGICAVLYFHNNVHNRIMIIVTSILCFPCVFMTNSRGPILFILIGFMMFLNLMKSKTYVLIMIMILGIILLMPILGEYSNVVLSLFDSKAQDEVGGSNSEMRINQLLTSIILVQDNLVFGLGQKFETVMNSSNIEDLLGMESMWFRIIPTYGFFGVIVYLYYAYISLIKIPRLFKSKYLFFFSLAYWIVESLTSTPGMLKHMYYLMIIYIIKHSEVYINIKNERI